MVFFVAFALLLAIPILVNYDRLGLRWLILHLPIVRSMSVMLRFWFVYIPVLCVLTALAFDRLVLDHTRRAWWSAAALALTLAQGAATNMTYYNEQDYSPDPISIAYTRLRSGGSVPVITRIADPWANDGHSIGASRNDSVVDGISAFPCYEPMFGYRMQVFRQGRLAPGPVLDAYNGRLNIKNPVCYVFPEANGCVPGDEFMSVQTAEAEDFTTYRPFRYDWPAWQYAAATLSAAAGLACLIGFLICLPLISIVSFRGRRGA